MQKIIVLIAVALSLSGCMTVPEAGAPYVGVSSQSVSGDTVKIDYVVSVGPGWIVIHADNGGKPGAVIGYAPVPDGVNKDVTVKIDAGNKTDTLFAMLHTDAGETGTYEFPQGDPPVKTGDKIVMKGFSTKEMPKSSYPSSSMGGGY